MVWEYRYNRCAFSACRSVFPGFSVISWLIKFISSWRLLSSSDEFAGSASRRVLHERVKKIPNASTRLSIRGIWYVIKFLIRVIHSSFLHGFFCLFFHTQSCVNLEERLPVFRVVGIDFGSPFIILSCLF